MKKILLFFLLLPFAVLSQQEYDFSDSAIENRLKKDIYFLASDSLKGREAGTNSEIVARDYIVNEFKKAGLQPYDLLDSSYFQVFEHEDTYWDYEQNMLSVNNYNYKLWSDFYPLANVGEGYVESPAEAVSINNLDTLATSVDFSDKIIFLIHVPLHSENILLDKATCFVEKHGAKAIVIVPAGDFYSFYSKKLSNKIPVLIFEPSNFDKINIEDLKNVRLQLTQQSKYKINNVIGWINNDAQYSIVIGGHYDHVGTRKDELSGEDVVFNGADDNASGAAAVMELARNLKQQGSKKYNYVFCAFSGEEKGLLGSYEFVKSKFYDSLHVKFMLDFDMVGRLGSFGNVLYLNGTGSSHQWRKILRKNATGDFFIKKIPDGMNGSDDFPFYKQGVPVLFFITGLHKEYHTPADDAEKINYAGEVQIIKYAQTLVGKISPETKLKFRKVNAWQTFISYITYAKMFF